MRKVGTVALALAGAAWLSAAGWLSSSVQARSPAASPTAQDSGEIQGVPWTGEPGITETVAEIMERERRIPKVGVGKIQPSKPEMEYRRRRRPRQRSRALAVSQWPTNARAEGPPELYNPQTVGFSFDGAMLAESGPPMLIPPDSMGDVGPTQVLVAINGRIKVYNKSGMVGGLNVPMNTFFASVNGGVGTSDPHVRFDRLSGRWFVTIITVPTMGPNRVLIAVSSSSTITNSSSFTFFQFQQDNPLPAGDTNGFADYDTLGVDKFALYIGVNMFDQTGSAFLGTTGFVVNKSDLLLANTLTVTAFRQMAPSLSACPGATGPYTPQGVNNDDPSATVGYFIGVDNCETPGLLQIRRVSSPGGTPTLSGNLTVSVPATGFPIDQVQPPPGPVLDALDDRLFAAAVHKNKITGTSTLWTAQNFEVNSSGVAQTGGGRNGSRWYEIQNLTTTPSLRQSGTLFDPAGSNPLGYWIPSVAMSGQGHMAIGTSRAGASSSNGFPSVAVAGRLRGDSLGTTQAPTLAQSSSFTYNVGTKTPERWGDYSQVGVDPIDDQTMWTFQEYANATNSYAVRAIALVAPPPATPSSANPSIIPTGVASTMVTITGTLSAGSEFFDPGPDSPAPAPAYNHVAAMVLGGVMVNAITFNSPTQVTLNVSTVGTPLGAKDVTITNPDGQSRTGTGLITVAPPPTMTINDVTVTEGTGGFTNATFTVSLSNSSPLTVSANYATADGTAKAGKDYIAASGTVTFPPGTTSRPITISVVGDTVVEPTETFFVNLSNPVNAILGDAQGQGNIVDDDVPAARVFVSVTGDDDNDCRNISTPCRTFAGGIFQTASGGEVIVLTTGSYGGATIGKSVTIDVPTVVVAFTASTMTIAGGPLDVVVLRGLVLKALTPGTGTGIAFTSGGRLYVEGSVVDGWNVGIDFASGGQLFVKDTTVRNSAGAGLRVAPASGTAQGSIDRSRFEGNGGCGVDVLASSSAAVRSSLATGNGSGFCAEMGSAELNLQSSLAAHNSQSGVRSAGGTARATRCLVTGNATGLDNQGGTLETLGNNLVQGNGTNTSGTITVVGGQ